MSNVVLCTLKNAVEVIKSGVDIGIAFDGDVDRVIFSDEKGNEVDGDLTMGLAAQKGASKVG